MKKLLTLTLITLLITTGAWAAGKGWVKQSAERKASASTVTGQGLLHRVIVTTDGGNPPTLNLYDSLTASGTKLIPSIVITTNTISDRFQSIVFDPPLRFYTGIYVSVSTSAGRYMVYWESE